MDPVLGGIICGIVLMIAIVVGQKIDEHEAEHDRLKEDTK